MAKKNLLKKILKEQASLEQAISEAEQFEIKFNIDPKEIPFPMPISKKLLRPCTSEEINNVLMSGICESSFGLSIGEANIVCKNIIKKMNLSDTNLFIIK